MKNSYFKLRDRFNFSPHVFEIGNPLIQTWYFTDNHLLKKIYGLAEPDYQPFYQFHLDHFLENNPAQERLFFEYVWKLITGRIHYYKMQDPFSSRQQLYQSNIGKLKSFQSMLKLVDRWDLHKPLEAVISEKNLEIQELKDQVETLKKEIQVLRKFESRKKIVIKKGHFGTFMDLILQMQKLKLPGDQELFTTDEQSSWYKMIAKYFSHDGKDIPAGTAQNYLPATKDKILIKGSEVYEGYKLFEITSLRKK